MNRDPQSDHSTVYQNSDSDHEPDSGAESTESAGVDSRPDLDDLIQRCLAYDRPRLFALVDATSDADPEGDSSSARGSSDGATPDGATHVDHAVGSGLVVAWGMEFLDRAVAYLRNPYTGKTTFSVHSSAERAHLLYQKVGPLHLVYPRR